jgi:hypothetical protein
MMMANLTTQRAPCLSVDVGHHEMKGTRATVPNVMERINVALIHIEICIC